MFNQNRLQSMQQERHLDRIDYNVSSHQFKRDKHLKERTKDYTD